ncbi:MAG: T9SS type A sorting domain-containing protein [Candidatus Kapaibacterium sp.]
MRISKIILFYALLILPLQLNSQVHEEWDVRYRGSNDNSISSKKVKYDSYGNVYVLGYASTNSGGTTITIKYNSRGEVQWVSRISGSYPVGMEIDNQGNVYISGATAEGGIIYKYSSFGVVQWQVSKAYYLNDMTIDDFGNVYITGYGSNGTNAGIQTIKYNSSGVLLWEQLHVSQNSGNYGYRIMLDNAGNVYTLGEWNYTGLYSIRVFKYNNDGQLQWIGISSQYFDIEYNDFAGLGIDDNGSVYVGGTKYNQLTKSDYIVVKFSQSGSELWYKIYNSEFNSNDKPKDMKVNGRGDVYITGQSFLDTTSNNSKVTTIKYDSTGSLKWKKDYTNPSGYLFPAAITTDIFGNIYVVINNSNYVKITTIKYDSTGTQKWLVDYIGATMQSVVYNISADNYGNVYLCGKTSGARNQECITIRYLQSWNSNFTVTGRVDYQDNSQPVEGGYMKAVKLDKFSGNVVTVDSTPIQVNGYYSLKHITQDSLYLIAFPQSNQPFIPTYYPQGINWKNAQKLFASSNISDMNISVQRMESISGDCTVKGKVVINDKIITHLKDAILYVKNGGSFVKYSVTDGNGLYQINSVQHGSAKILVDRLGYSSDSISINLVSGSTYDNVNFNLNQIYVRIIKDENLLPLKYSLSQNYPNPFNPNTVISFQLSVDSKVSIKVYDVQGREVQTLVNERMNAGTYETTFDGSGLNSGVYFYRMVTDGYRETKRMMLIK